MTGHPEVLSRNQERVLVESGAFLTGRGFYLAGGTAVALHLGHRRSVDGLSNATFCCAILAASPLGRVPG
jgi:hypothetical protein